jgi:hypothetical protein
MHLEENSFFAEHENNPPSDCERLKFTTTSDRRIFVAVWPKL